jgi:hypothetical protein
MTTKKPSPTDTNPVPALPTLLCYTLQGTQPRFLASDTPNPDYLAEIYVCAMSIRDMRGLLRLHMTTEEVSVEGFASARKEWPPNMKWVSRSLGVWGSRFPNGPTVFKFSNGSKTEEDS